MATCFVCNDYTLEEGAPLHLWQNCPRLTGSNSYAGPRDRVVALPVGATELERKRCAREALEAAGLTQAWVSVEGRALAVGFRSPVTCRQVEDALHGRGLGCYSWHLQGSGGTVTYLAPK